MSDVSPDAEVGAGAGVGAGADAGAEAGRESTVLASQVRVGDVLRSRDGTEFTVSRIEAFPMFGPPLIAFIEDTDAKWFKMPSAQDGEVTLVRRGA